METVSWDEAVEFCRKLSEWPEEKAAGRIYRLPTEAEWEYACRAGSTTRYSFGNDPTGLGDHAWISDNSSITTHPVGLKLANAWGFYDMHGNVSEWCADWSGKDYYMCSPVDDPTGPPTGFGRVYRGGCWFFSAERCRSARRLVDDPSARYANLGCRVATTPSASPASPVSETKSDNR